MRSVAFAMVALLGACDAVFGLERDGVPIDASVSADGPPDGARGIVRFEVMQPVNVGESKLVQARLFDEAEKEVPWTLTATAGTFDKASGMVKLDGIGVGDIESQWRAPSTPGPVTLQLDALGDRASLMVDVHALQTSGFDSNGTMSMVLGGDGAFGSSFMVVQAGTVVSLGVWVESGGGNRGRLALYTDAAGFPGTKLAETAGMLLVNQRNAMPVTAPVALQPGMYWVVANFNGNTAVRFASTAAYVSKAVAFNGSFPAQFGAATVTTGSRIQVFATLSQ